MSLGEETVRAVENTSSGGTGAERGSGVQSEIQEVLSVSTNAHALLSSWSAKKQRLGRVQV